jgi:hypothetical protein
MAAAFPRKVIDCELSSCDAVRRHHQSAECEHDGLGILQHTSCSRKYAIVSFLSVDLPSIVAFPSISVKSKVWMRSSPAGLVEVTTDASVSLTLNPQFIFDPCSLLTTVKIHSHSRYGLFLNKVRCSLRSLRHTISRGLMCHTRNIATL